jgi:hypothetical protein
MTDEQRRPVAYIAGRLTSSSNAIGVFDYSTGRRTSMSGDVRPDRVNVTTATGTAAPQATLRFSTPTTALIGSP